MSGGSVRPTCPNGGIWHICLTSPSQYVGCCKSNPCSNATGCPQQDITAASFEPASYGQFPDQTCAAGQGNFYTCTFPGQNRASFIGCCRTDPCVQGGCPATDLGAASVNSARIQPFITAVGGLGVMSFATTSTTSSQSTSTIASSSEMTASSSSTSSSSISSSSHSSSGASSTSNGDPFSGTASAISNWQMSKGTIAGITVAAIVLVAAIAAILLFICTRRRRMARQLRTSHKEMIEEEPTRDGIVNVSSAGLFSPQRSTINRVSSLHPNPTYASPVAVAGAQDSQEPLGPAKSSFVAAAVAAAAGRDEQRGRSAVGNRSSHHNDNRNSNNLSNNLNPTGRYYMTPSPSNYSRTSPAPPYDMDQRFSTSPSFPPHPTMLAGLHVANPQDSERPDHDNHDHEDHDNRRRSIDQHSDQDEQEDDDEHHTRHSSGVGYAVPMLPSDLWPATSLATVHEIASDAGDTASVYDDPASARSSGTFMVAAGQRTSDQSPKRGSVARDYAASVMLARSPPPAERDSGRWSNGVPRRKSLVGEVYDNLREA